MKIAYTTTFDAQDVHNWSGTPYHMSCALKEEGVDLQYIGSLKRILPPFFKVKQTLSKYLAGQRESPRFNIEAAKHYSMQVAQQLNERPVDAIVSPLINPIAYLQSKPPIILWTDAVYASLIGFYPPFAYHSARTIQEGNILTTECLARCKLAIFSSHWALNNALELYGVSRDKLKVVPFGANIESPPDWEEIQTIIKNRPKDKINLLFLAKSWERKGGDTVLAVAKALYESGYPVELNIVGYPVSSSIASLKYVNSLGFISKHTPDGKKRLRKILSDTHFLFVPSRAEAYGIVFCEANAFAVPCLSTYVGGIGTIIKDEINGMTFGLDTPITTYCDYIINLMNDSLRYESMAYHAYHEYKTRLNWTVAARTVKQMIAEIL